MRFEPRPETIAELAARWSLTIGAAYDGASCAWVARAVRADGLPVVLKIGMPHMEGRDEIAGLRLWNGDPTVRLLDADETLNAMLLERCEPGTSLRTLPEEEQDLVLAGLLRRLWRRPPSTHPFRPLSTMIAFWMAETDAARAHWGDDGLVRAGLRVFETLKHAPADDWLLATDLHAGNVVLAHDAWRVIDPKPFIGERAYDATQHLLNCRTRMLADPNGTIERVTDLLGVDAGRVRLWTFARSAAEPRDAWTEDSFAIARALA